MLHKNLKPFPEHFLWEASTSAYQVEGVALENGKDLSCQDVEEIPTGTADLSVSIDRYRHYKEDIALMAETGFKSYRFSISRTRVLSDGTGEVNPKGIEFYNNLIDECLKYDTEPIVIMFYFDMPTALDERGSRSTHDSIDWLTEYTRVLFENSSDRVKHWLTINRQDILILVGPVIGTFHVSERITNLIKEIYQQSHHQLVAQAKAMQLCHEMFPDAKIGPAPNTSLVYPVSSKPENAITAQNFNALRNRLYLDAYAFGKYNDLAWVYLEENDALSTVIDEDRATMKAARPDFTGLSYYNAAIVEVPGGSEVAGANDDRQLDQTFLGFAKSVDSPNLMKTEFGWEADLVGFHATTRETYSRYRLPLLVTGDGPGVYDTLTEDGKIHDNYHIECLRQHTAQTQLAISDSVDMLGYNPRSVIDLVSTHKGVRKRYGFIHVDRTDEEIGSLKHRRRDPFFWYKKIAAANGRDLSD